MGDFDWDWQRHIQIIVILLIFFAGFLRMLFGALMKAGKKGLEDGGKFMPPKDLQEFLKEIRGERVETEKRPPPALEPAERQAKLQGERAKRDHDAFRGHDAARDRGRPARREVPEGRPAAKEQPAGQGERKESVHEYLEHLKKESLAEEKFREATVEAEEPAGEPLHPLPARPLSRADEEFAARFGRLTESEPAPRAHLRWGLQEIQQGLTLREAIVAQTILGPPRCKDPLRARPGPRGGPRRSAGEGAPGRG